MANISISGGTSPTVAVYGKNLFVSTGVGTDSVGSSSLNSTVGVGKLANVSVGIPMSTAAVGHDTITSGSGLDTVVTSGQASLTSAFGNALGNSSISGGVLGTTLNNAGADVSGVLGGVQANLSTVIGGALDTASVTLSNAGADVQGVLSGVTQVAAVTVGNLSQVAGVTAGNALIDVAGVAQGPPAIAAATLSNVSAQVGGVFSGLTSSIHALNGGTGADSLTGGASPLSHFLTTGAGGQTAVTNFVSNAATSVNGYSLSYLQANHAVTSQGGNTYISLDGGKTSIELKGIGGLNSSESALHKS